MHALTIFSSVAVLLLAVVHNQAQSGPYRKSTGLSPVEDTAPSHQEPARGPATDPGAIPPGEPGYEAPKRTKVDPSLKELDEAGRQLLLRFDDYLFKNLEDVYYRLSYAFKDAAKKTQNMCGCDPGSLVPANADEEPAK